MNNDSEKELEIEEIQRRLEYLKSTDQISIAKKLAIVKKALEIVDIGDSEVKEGP
jgi:hypothetical protein